MKPGAGIVPLLLGLAWLPLTLPAAEVTAPTKPPRTRMQDQLHRLVRTEFALPAAPAVPVSEAEAGPTAGTGETLYLEPMVIEEPKLKSLPPPETRVEEFFRTGTIWEKRGPKFTQQFWIGRGQGIGFTLSW